MRLNSGSSPIFSTRILVARRKKGKCAASGQRYTTARAQLCGHHHYLGARSGRSRASSALRIGSLGGCRDAKDGRPARSSHLLFHNIFRWIDGGSSGRREALQPPQLPCKDPKSRRKKYLGLTIRSDWKRHKQSPKILLKTQSSRTLILKRLPGWPESGTSVSPYVRTRSLGKCWLSLLGAH